MSRNYIIYGEPLWYTLHSYEKENLISHKSSIILVGLGFILYVILWSFISVEKYFALNASVYDLGFSMQNLWYVTHDVNTIKGLLSILSTKGILIFLAPLYYVASPPLLLILQSISLGFGAFPIYAISIKLIHNKKIALINSALYLIYFPMAGINWFDFHFQMFFVPLFLLAYYFYINDRKKLSSLFLFLSGIVRYPYYIFPMFFIFLIIIRYFYSKYKGDSSNTQKGFPYSLLVTFIILLLLSIYQVFLVGGTSGLSEDVTKTGLVFNFLSIKNGFEILIFLFYPLLFIPLLSKKWILFMFPFGFLVFTSYTFPYSFPSVFQLQYTSMIIPFVWLAYIDGLSTILKEESGLLLKKLRGRLKITLIHAKNKVLLIVALVVIISALFFQPYGPLNSSSSIDYNLSQEIAVNQSQLNSLHQLLHLIPNGEIYVFVQDNLPQAFIKHMSQYVISVVPSSVVDANIINNKFLYNFGGNISINYLIGDVNNYQFYLGSNSVLNFSSILFESGYYAIIGESNGLFLLQRLPISLNSYLTPLHFSFQPPQSRPKINTENNSSYQIYSFNIFNQYLPDTYTHYLFPGNYNISGQILMNNAINDTNLTVEVIDQSNTVLSHEVIYLNKFTNQLVFQMNLSVSTFHRAIYLKILTSSTNSSLKINLINIAQRTIFTEV